MHRTHLHSRDHLHSMDLGLDRECVHSMGLHRECLLSMGLHREGLHSRGRECLHRECLQGLVCRRRRQHRVLWCSHRDLSRPKQKGRRRSNTTPALTWVHRRHHHRRLRGRKEHLRSPCPAHSPDFQEGTVKLARSLCLRVAHRLPHPYACPKTSFTSPPPNQRCRTYPVTPTADQTDRHSTR